MPLPDLSNLPQLPNPFETIDLSPKGSLSSLTSDTIENLPNTTEGLAIKATHARVLSYSGKHK